MNDPGNHSSTMCRLACKYFSILLLFISVGQVAWGQTRIYATGDNTDETEFNKISKSAIRAQRDLNNLPASFSIKQYAPVPGDQGKSGTCVAWSSSYAARTISYCIQHLITDPAQIKALRFSPNYIYHYVKQSTDDDCSAGAKVETAMKVLTEKGDVLLTDGVPDCASQIEKSIEKNAPNYSIKAYSALTNSFGIISKNEILAIKKGISEKKPVIFSLKCYKSMFGVDKSGVWKIPANDSLVGNHALCIVGYDDNKEGGSFEIMNSWGTEWGNQGFGWISYEQLKTFGRYALELMDRESYDPGTTRSMGNPKLKGSLDFVLVDEGGIEIKAMPTVRSFINKDGNEVADPSKASFTNYRLIEKYMANQRFKIGFTTNAPAFVYIFAIDDQQTISPLFPYADNVSPAINSTNATVYLPSETKGYRIKPGAKRDQLIVIYSKLPINYSELMTEINSAPSKYLETIATRFGTRMIPVRGIQFAGEKISFEVPAREEQLICFLVDINYSN